MTVVVDALREPATEELWTCPLAGALAWMTGILTVFAPLATWAYQRQTV